MRKVLVIDDDPAIVEVLRTVLEDAGFAVIAAASIDRVPAGTKADCVVADLVGVSSYSLETARAALRPVRARFADAPLIVATAHRVAVHDRDELGVAALLAKPFDVDEAVRLVQSVLITS